MKKVYCVNVSIDFDMYVLATDEKDARKVAKDHVDDELSNGVVTPSFDVGEADPIFHAGEDSIPWGDAPDEEHVDNTVAEYMAEVLAAQREEEAQRTFEANQLKLFPEGA